MHQDLSLVIYNYTFCFDEINYMIINKGQHCILLIWILKKVKKSRQVLYLEINYLKSKSGHVIYQGFPNGGKLPPWVGF